MANPDTITINSIVFDVYGPLADADAYFQGKLNRSSWVDASSSEKNRALISATRDLDLLSWQGSPTDLVTPQPLAWARTGVIDKNGESVGAAVFPTELLYGYYELAQAYLDDPALSETVDQSSNIQSVTADVVTVKFFRPTPGSVLPEQVFTYIRQFMQMDQLSALAYGTDVVSSFGEPIADLAEPYK